LISSLQVVKNNRQGDQGSKKEKIGIAKGNSQ